MLVLLDNGHGGLINGKYQTSGKSINWKDKGVIYEGEFNRAIVNGIIQELTRLNINYVSIAPEYRDVTLYTRVNRANKFYKEKCFYLSVHANAGGGTGAEVFTYYGESKSDKIATIFGEEFKKEFPQKPLRVDYRDGDLDKEASFYVLRKTLMPAILTENFFMDNFQEFNEILNTAGGRNKIINYHIQTILRVKKELF
ncbi:N-acetylmuramoyl-L-alanine amidase [Mesonia sp. K4-1]|uniref:N-acetylmuramoyl-L-alanine amidase n=1 Tax=Mesonia sp. K4-1 TaxID=2602760 RepID=UPI0011C917AA|nr:N-acetylmuramoyl-L-alanine amidase [Mesonia sp. K4-1]TXK74412.1 N-acetylmuramoyl-L-alanine amidase [Mesonia sp. K4-1]